VCPREKVTLLVIHGVPHREGYSMGGPWFAIVEKGTQWVVHVLPHIEGYAIMGGLWLATMGRLHFAWVAHGVPHRE